MALCDVCEWNEWYDNELMMLKQIKFNIWIYLKVENLQALINFTDSLRTDGSTYYQFHVTYRG